eukprot:15454600-Alexandrium_andersonii.AAC.1
MRGACVLGVPHADGCVLGARAPLKRWPTTQKTIALSSGEAELACVVKGAAEVLGLEAIAQDLGFAVSLG